MSSKEEEYKELFVGEANENHEEVNRLLTDLEKNPENKEVINAIFRITHTLKGNAAGMGFADIASFSHVLEDLFGEVREGRLVLTGDIITMLFRAVDVLGGLIDSLKSGKTIRRRGIQTKMEVLIKSSRGEDKPEKVEVEEKADDSKAVKAISDGEKEKPKNKKSKKKTTKGEEANLAETVENEKVPIEDEQEGIENEIVAGPQVEEGPNTITEEEKEEEREEAIQEQEYDSDKNKITLSDMVQVPVRKLDNLLNLVGELIIERDRIIAISNASVNEFSRLNRISSDLQYSVMDVRLVQVGFLFNKFHRVVRDAASQENKIVDLRLTGTETEIDRNILQIISDSLIHIVRNSIGHGIELPEERIKLGKPKVGRLELIAKSESDAVIIDIIDDGKGVDIERVKQKVVEKGLVKQEIADQLPDNEIVMYIFEPGFSTMDSVTAISGRGVGMDVVKRALDSIGGTIFVDTQKGKGSRISLKLPSSMAVKGTLLFELERETFAIPLTYTEAVVSLKKSEIHKVGHGLVATHLDKTISIVFLRDIFELGENTVIEGNYLHRSFNDLDPDKELHIVICSYNGRTIGFVVDKLLQRKEIVEKPLMKPVDKVKYINGVTILGNGNVCLVINVAGITNFVFTNSLKN